MDQKAEEFFKNSRCLQKQLSIVLFIQFLVFGFWSLLWTKLWKYYIIFIYILQGEMSQTENNEKKIMQPKWPKYQKPKDENMEWKKHLPIVR